MQEVGVVTDKNGWEIVGDKQYSSRSGSAGMYRVEEAGGIDEGDVWLEIGGVGRGLIGLKSGK